MPAYTFDDTAPGNTNFPYAVYVLAQTTANQSLAAAPSTVDGVSTVGLYYRGANNSLLLLNNQSTSAENGVYMMDADTGTIVSVTGNFSSGSYTLSGLSNSTMYAVKALSSTVLTVSDGTTTTTFATDANGERWAMVKSSGTGTLIFTGPTTGAASGLLSANPAKLVLNTTGLTYDAIGNGVFVVNGTANKSKWYILTALSAAGVRTYTVQATAPTGTFLQFTDIAPTAITL